MEHRGRVWAFLGAWAAFACGGPAAEGSSSTLRSPTTDYPSPAAQTSNGEVVGADRVPPGDKLQTSPSVGSSGVSPAAPTAPPETANGAPTSPCDQIGLEDASGKSDCDKKKQVPVRAPAH